MSRSPSRSVNVRRMSDQAVAVIRAPRAFFRTMPKTGGFLEPLVFMIVLAFVSGFLFALGYFLGVNPLAGLIMAVGSLVLIPVMITILGFILSAGLFLIWRILGSRQSFETSYRVFAYTYSISPITTVLNFLPYLGIVGLVWNFLLLAIASVEVHRIPRRLAYPVFALLTVAIAALGIALQPRLRALQQEMVRPPAQVAPAGHAQPQPR